MVLWITPGSISDHTLITPDVSISIYYLYTDILTYLRITKLFKLKLSGPSPLTRAYCRAVNYLLSTKMLRPFHVRFWFYFILQKTPDQLLYPHTHSLSTCKSKSHGGWGCSQEREAGAFPILLLGNPIHCSGCKATHRNP